MGRDKIAGRHDEIRVLQQSVESGRPEFIAIYGRRRVGKTFLVREFFGPMICFELIGVHQASLSMQLKNFSVSLGKTMALEIEPRVAGSWQEAFLQLERFLRTPAVLSDPGKKVIFLDELPWLDTNRSNFLPSLEHFWNSFASGRNDLILVICGSAASWMIRKIVNARGGLHNRLTRRLKLKPFTLAETAEFLSMNKVSLTKMQIAELYMVMGGVPFYLQHVEPGQSASQAIDRLCFSPQGILRHEFSGLFSSLFDESSRHMLVIESLSKKRSGILRKELLEITGMASGGTFSLTMDELEESGFIESSVPWGKKANDRIYRLTDEFTMFHLNWISALGRSDPGEGHWTAGRNSPKYRAWSGYAFENIVQKHVHQIKTALGIAMVETKSAPWIARPNRETGQGGAQIDLLIDRKDATINMCEIKFSEDTFTIDKKYAAELRNKINVFRNTVKTRKNIFLTMVTTYGLNENEYSREIVQNSVILDDLFRP